MKWITHLTTTLLATVTLSANAMDAEFINYILSVRYETVVKEYSTAKRYFELCRITEDHVSDNLIDAAKEELNHTIQIYRRVSYDEASTIIDHAIKASYDETGDVLDATINGMRMRSVSLCQIEARKRLVKSLTATGAFMAFLQIKKFTEK